MNFAHAYWILDSYFLEKDKYGLSKDARILKIKNPKISTWKGDWSIESPLWTDEIKELVNYNPDDRGEFYISFEDYWTYFYKTTVCYYDPEINWNTLELSHRPESSVLIKLFIEEEEKISFKISQIQRWLFPRSFKYKVAPTHVVIAKLALGKNY